MNPSRTFRFLSLVLDMSETNTPFDIFLIFLTIYKETKEKLFYLKEVKEFVYIIKTLQNRYIKEK